MRRESDSQHQRLAQQGKHKSQPPATTGSTGSGGNPPLESPAPPAPATRQTTNKGHRGKALRDRLDRQPAIRGSRRMRANTARIRRHEQTGRTPISDHQLTRRHSMGSAPQHAPPPAEERQQSTQRRLKRRPQNPASDPRDTHQGHRHGNHATQQRATDDPQSRPTHHTLQTPQTPHRR
jgi:hypothetical protein